MEQIEKFSQLRLIRSDKISNTTFWALIKQYGSAESAIKMIVKTGQYDLCDETKILTEIDNMKRINARFVFMDSDLYPPNLKLINNPPPILSFLGNATKVTNLLKQKALAVVGSRNATLNGMRFCFGICEQLANSGLTVISGLAKGIDTSAHKGSLPHGTIAIIAGGINYIYPQENKKLYSQILKTGGIYAEMPYNTYPAAGLFPRRNHIIAGIADGTLVIEAASQSGSLITAELAKKFNRQVFAVPNSPLDARSQGTNNLIKNGAIVVTYASDILNAFFKKELFSPEEIDTATFRYTVDSDIKSTILKLLDTYAIKIDELTNCINAPAGEIAAVLVELEMSGLIKRTLGGEIIYIGK